MVLVPMTAELPIGTQTAILRQLGLRHGDLSGRR